MNHSGKAKAGVASLGSGMAKAAQRGQGAKQMKAFRRGLAAIVMPVATALVVATSSVAAASPGGASGPVVSSVDYHYLRPSRIGVDGSVWAQVVVHTGDAFCSMNVYRSIDNRKTFTSIGTTRQLTFADHLDPSTIAATTRLAYQVRLVSCAGVVGSAASSPSWRLEVLDEQDYLFDGTPYLHIGTYKSQRVDYPDAYEGHYALAYTKMGQGFYVPLDGVHELAIYGCKFPSGGVARVTYRDTTSGKPAKVVGTFSFYGSSLSCRHLLFRTNLPGIANSGDGTGEWDFQIVAAGRGGGTAMAVDAMSDLWTSVCGC
jgi:hypothetical protein